MPELAYTTDRNLQWYQYLDNFFNVEPFSTIKQLNKILKKSKSGKKISRRQRKKLNALNKKVKIYLEMWGSNKMEDFRNYITHLLNSVFAKFADREKLEFSAKQHQIDFRQRSFFVIYNVLKKYLRTIKTNEIYSGVFDKNIMTVMTGITKYIPFQNSNSAEDTRSRPNTASRNKRGCLSEIPKLDVVDKKPDLKTLEAARVLSAAILIHKNYIKYMRKKSMRDDRIGGEKLDKFKRIMKKKIFSLAKGSNKRKIHQNRKGYMQSKDDIGYNSMKKIQEIKAKTRALKRAHKEICYNILYRYPGKRKKGKPEKTVKKLPCDEVIEKEDEEKRTRRMDMWEESRQRILTVRNIEKTEGERVLVNIKNMESRKKKEFLLKCREGFEELFILSPPALSQEVRLREDGSILLSKSNEWLVHKPSARVYYERESVRVKTPEEQEENLLELCKSSSSISGDVSATNDFVSEKSEQDISSISKTESVYTDEYYLDGMSECFREIEDGAFLASSTESANTLGLDQDYINPNEDLCVDYEIEGVTDQTTFFKYITKNRPEKIKTYIKEDELSITSELMQELCETSGSETSDTTYSFEPPKEKIPEEKPEINDQPINFRAMNHRKLQLNLMEKECKASDVSSVSEFNVWTKAIFKLKQREKSYYKKMGITESYERLKAEIKHLSNRISRAKHNRPVVLDSSAKGDFIVETTKKMFEEVNIDEKNKFPIISNTAVTKPEKGLVKIPKSRSSDHISSLCRSGSCFKSSDSSQISELESEDVTNRIESIMKQLNLKKSYKRQNIAYKRFLEGIRKNPPYIEKNMEMTRPASAPSDIRKHNHSPTKKGLLGIAEYSTVDDIGPSNFPKDSAGRDKGETKTTLEIIDLPNSPSTQELERLFYKLHPKLPTDGINHPEHAISSSECEEDTNFTSKRKVKSADKKTIDQMVDVESLLSRDAKSIEDDYYSVIKKKKEAAKKVDQVKDDKMEFRVKVCSIRYSTLKSEKMWRRHHHPDFLYFFRWLLFRRIPTSLTNLKLRTTIPFLKPDNEMFELPHYSLLPTLHPIITYKSSQPIEHRILWDRPERFKLHYNELRDKDYISDKSRKQLSTIENISNTDLDLPIEEEELEYKINQFDPLQTADLNWLHWNPPEYNNCLTNENIRRVLQDLGAAPEIYDKLEILLKNKKLGYAPMKELLSNNQEKLFHYVCSQFLNKLSIKYPKRFLRLLFFAYNQYGVQKHICTFIKPTRLKSPSLDDWQGCARFISNRFHLKPLTNNNYPPLQLNGPDRTLYHQEGNLYELAILLESILLGAGYDAYVVSGMVTQVRASGMTEEHAPDEKDIVAPEIGFKGRSSEQIITIETFFKSLERDKLSERLEKQFKEEPMLLEEIYIEKIAEKGGWQDPIKYKSQQYIEKMANVDLIEKFKQEIKERQQRRDSTKELEALLQKLQEERIQYLQEKRTDIVQQEDAVTLEEELKKYFYTPDVEIKSVYVENMKIRELKERTQEKLLQERADEEKINKEKEEKYFKNLYSKYQEIVELPPVLKTQRQYEEEKLKFFDEMREHIGEQIEEFDHTVEEQKASFAYADVHFIREDLYQLYFGKIIKKERVRKIKKSEKEKSKETEIEGEAVEKKLSEIRVSRETVHDSEEERKTENVSIMEEAEREDEDYISEEMSEEEVFEFMPASEQELPKKKKINKKAIRKLRAKLEKTYPTLKEELRAIPTKKPLPIERIKAVNPVIYCWILIKRNDHDIKHDCFLDVGTGLLYPTLDKQYLRIDSVWNDKNYYVPYYQRKHVKKTRMFDFKNENLWWHLLCGEPKKHQQLRRTMRDVEDPMIQKHLEVPRTWVGHMKFPKRRFDKFFKDEKMKTWRYKKLRIDLFEYGTTHDGIRKRVIEFYNIRQTRVKCIRETFENRNDYLIYRTKFYRNERNINIDKDAVKTSEVFEPGRPDNLKCFRLYQYPDGRKLIDMFFYAEFRIDFLKMFSISKTRLKMQFLKGRTDQMIKLKMSYYDNAFFDKRCHRESRFTRIVVTYHHKAIHLHYLKLLGSFQDPPIRLDIDLKAGLSYYFFKDEGENELKFAIWQLHYNIVEETYINPNVQPNRVYFFGSSEKRKSTLEREIMLEREHADKIKYLNLAYITEKECHEIIKQRGDDEQNIFVDVSRRSKWYPGETEKLKIEQLYLIAERVERRLNTLREKNILSYFEDLAEGRKIDFVIMQMLKSIAGEQFNLKLAQLINQLFQKWEKAQEKGCPSAKFFAMLADKFCKFIDAYKTYFLKHCQEAEKYYENLDKIEEDGSEDLIRKYIYGENFKDNVSNLKNVLDLFSPKSMAMWFDKWFKKQIQKYGTRDVGEMIQSIDEILLLREPKLKPINTSFWKALGEFQNTSEYKQDDVPFADKASVSFPLGSMARNVLTDKKEMESTDTDTKDTCESVLANYIDKKCDKEEDNDGGIFDKEEKEEADLENDFIQQIKELVKRYGIVKIKEGLIKLGMEKYLFNIQKDAGSASCALFAGGLKKRECQEYKQELLRKRKINKIKENQDLDKMHESELPYTPGSTTSFQDKVEKALSEYPWNLKPKRLHKDLKTMVETLETELMKCNLKHYTMPQPLLAQVGKSESSTGSILPGRVVKKKPNKQTRKIIPLIKKSMKGKVETNQQKALSNIIFKLILKDQKGTNPEELANIYKKLKSEGKEARGPRCNNYGGRLKQLLTETFQQKILDAAIKDYRFQEDYLGIKDLDKARERYGKFAHTDIRESLSEKKKIVASESAMNLKKNKKAGGYLPSFEHYLDRKKKLKEYEKKRIESLSHKKNPELHTHNKESKRK